jgi:acetyltransferase
MDNMKKMFDPETVALIGASEREGSPGRSIIENLLACRERKIFTVNPNRKTVLDRDCYASIKDVPDHVNLAIIATAANTVPRLVEECGQAGVDGLIIISEGFREAGEDGRKLEEEIIRIRRQYGMRILGPNCMGIIRPNAGFCATHLSGVPDAGKVALLTQSNAFGKTLFDWGVKVHIGFSMLASLGSAIDIDFGDLIDYLGTDPHTRSIMIYMEEGIGDVRKFVSAARGFARYKPLVLLKPPVIGDDPSVKITHTDILAGAEDVFDAVMRRIGVVRVRESQDLLNVAGVLDSRNLPQGARLAIISNASGAGILAANRLLRSGGRVAELSADTIQTLKHILPAYWQPGNPVDILRSADAERYGKSMQACLKDDGVDGLLVVVAPQEADAADAVAAVVASLAGKAGKPVLAAWLGGEGFDRSRDVLIHNNIPTYETPEEAARTYVYMYNYERNLELLHETPSELTVDEAPPKNHLKSSIRKVIREGGQVLSDEDARKFLSTYGIPTVKTCTASSLADAISCAREIGYPIVLKIASPDIVFRQDVGGVFIGINSDEALRDGYEKLMKRLSERQPQATIRGVTIQKMIDVIDYELILGAKKDRQFGAAIVFGMGGIGVEIFRDFSIGLPPLNQTLARLLMEETKIYQMLQGYRGKAPADLRQIEQIIVGFSNLIMDFPEIQAMDINPIAVSNGRAYALDARIVLDRNEPTAPAPYPHLIITPYPTRYVSRWNLRDGTEVLLRPIKPEDEPLEHEMFTSLSEATLRERFYHTIKNITHDMHVRFCNIDYNREMAIVAEIRENGKRKLAGIGSFNIESDFRRCEFSVLVHDDFQGKGLAYKLVDLLIGIADEKGMEEFYGYIQPNNRRMVRLCEKLGMTRESTPDDLAVVRLLLR